ncbi:clavaminate synthase-like protein At3g21360 [Setaria viridis]|uniref:clavaminate synthase-like protein At3g21360 n=1 Tax=Setaria viridis TaxID=4556 RepID=UPI0014932B20|nr:uncharacterized protein LOC117844196 [Setaria viridis]
MEGTSKDDQFIADECKDQNMKDGAPLKESGSNDDYEALMAALNANREWLQAKVSINNALVTEGNSQSSQPRECEGQKTKIPEGGETPFVRSFRVTERAMEEFPEMVEVLDAKGLRYALTALTKNDNKSMRGRGWEDAFRRRGRRMWFNTVVGMHGKEVSCHGGRWWQEIPTIFFSGSERSSRRRGFQFQWCRGDDILILDNLASPCSKRSGRHCRPGGSSSRRASDEDVSVD